MFWKSSRSSNRGSSPFHQFKPVVEQLEARNVLDASLPADVLQLAGSIPQLLSDGTSGKPTQQDEAQLTTEISALTIDYGTVSKALAQSEAVFQELGMNASPSARVALQNYVDILNAQMAQAQDGVLPHFLETVKGVIDLKDFVHLEEAIANFVANSAITVAQIGPQQFLQDLQNAEAAATLLKATGLNELYEGGTHLYQDFTTIQETQQALYQTGTFLQQHPEVLGITPTNHDPDNDGDIDMY